MPRALRPSDVDLHLEFNPAAPEQLHELGTAYWELAGLDPDTGSPVWVQRTGELDFTPWAQPAHIAAAAAVTATALAYSSASCEGKLTLTSRNALKEAIEGRDIQCRACNTTVEQRVASTLHPKALEYRAKRIAEQQVHAAAMETKRELEQSQRDAISERYPVDDEDPISRISEAPIVARVGALAVLHAVGDRAGLIYPIEFHNSTIAPSNTFSEQLFVDAWHFNLLHVHPTSPTDAFVWDDGTTLGTTLGTSIYPEQTRFFVPGMGTLENRLETFVHCLRDGLDLSAMWSYDRPELSDLVHKVIAEEAGRYLAYQLRQHNLPDRTDRHNEVLRTVTTRGASLFSLGHLYRMAWSSARDASSAKQRHPSMSTENAITHGLNQFEQRIQKASYDRGSLNEPFSEDNNLPLTSVTDIVFRIILGMDPMSSEPAHIADMLSAAPDDELRALCEAGIPSHRELMERIRTSTDEWDGYEFRRILARLEQQPPDACAPRCAHDRLTDVASEGGQVYDRIVSRVGEADAAIVTAEATSLANAGHNGLRADDALLSAVVHLLLPLTDLEPAILAEQE